MIYLINQEWTNTSNNHAGMKYLCNKLQELHPEIYKSICIEDFYKEIKNNKISRLLQQYVVKYKYKKETERIFEHLKKSYRKGDKIILMEYFEKLYPQNLLAQKLKSFNINIPIYGLVHLVPSKLNNSFSDIELYEWSKYIDKFITLGSSLTKYITNKGIASSRIITLFHYVDTEYYAPTNKNKKYQTPLKVIAMGNQMRNTKLLHHVISQNKNVNFIVCQGTVNLSSHFIDCPNVKLIPFVSEEKLKEYMNNSDVSLNVMTDTIGSNVITTSMAMGLAMICSDVGSIRDYCDETNTIFCNNNDIETWSNAINTLVKNPAIINELQSASIKKSKYLSIPEFHNAFIKEIL